MLTDEGGLKTQLNVKIRTTPCAEYKIRVTVNAQLTPRLRFATQGKDQRWLTPPKRSEFMVAISKLFLISLN